MRINIPAGFHGAYIDPISKNKGEKEYLLKEDKS
ncbi:ADP-ribosyltransferase [Levilactobacillus brevis]|nr:ADP-ribosyltransferase [Levilactobacillus brevis]